MDKYTFVNNELRFTPYNHAYCIKGNETGFTYDEAVRLIIFTDLRLVYIRINDFSYSYGLEAKRLEFKFNYNLEACISYLKGKFKGFKIYNSYTINELPYELRKEILEI